MLDPTSQDNGGQTRPKHSLQKRRCNLAQNISNSSFLVEKKLSVELDYSPATASLHRLGHVILFAVRLLGQLLQS